MHLLSGLIRSSLRPPLSGRPGGRLGAIGCQCQPKAIAECLDAVFPAIPYCVDLIGGPFLTTNEERLVAFRPKKK